MQENPDECWYYPIVVMPILMNHYVMLQRNLIYTGITRAKKVLVMVGSKKALAYACHNVTVEKRNTQLSGRIRRLAGHFIALNTQKEQKNLLQFSENMII